MKVAELGTLRSDMSLIRPREPTGEAEPLAFHDAVGVTTQQHQLARAASRATLRFEIDAVWGCRVQQRKEVVSSDDCPVGERKAS